MKNPAPLQLVSRRSFIRGCAAASALCAAPGAWAGAGDFAGADLADRALSLDDGWSFARKGTGVPSAAPAPIRLPHSVVPLSWQKWDPASWQDVWLYRRQFTVPPEWRNLRLFLHFERVMAVASPAVNGHALAAHAGGFLPFDREITQFVAPGDNLLEVTVDGR